MPTISAELRAEIDEYLSGIQEFDNEDMRKRIALYANFSKTLFENISWNKNPLRVFVPYLIESLINWVEVDENGEETNALIQYLVASQSEVSAGDSSKAKQLVQSIEVEFSNQLGTTGSEFKFVNREDEISELTAEVSFPRHVIHAPAGFGKTWFLGRLHYVFTNKKWLVAKAVLDRTTTSRELAIALLRSVDININESFDGDTEEDIAEKFYGILNKIWENRQNSKGIVLLVDTCVLPTEIASFDQIVSKWLPEVIRNFQEGTAYFSSEVSRFRVFLAGRFFDIGMIRLLHALDGNYYFKGLTPFSDGVISTSVNSNKQLMKMQSDRRAELIAYLFYFSGGHPGILNKIIKYYLDSNKPMPKKFFENNTSLIEQMVTEELDTILHDIPEESRNFLISLSPFRYLSYEVIDEFLESSDLSVFSFPSVNSVLNHLTQGYLLTWDEQTGQLLSDDISRRIMALHVRLRKGNNLEYSKQCSIAKEIYLKRLSDFSDSSTVRWAIEYLYQSLQEATYLINNIDGRKELRRKFWGPSDEGTISPAADSILYQCLQRLNKGRENRNLIHALERVLANPKSVDWEFAFHLNFYFRDEQFNQKWFGILLGKIQSYLLSSGRK